MEETIDLDGYRIIIQLEIGPSNPFLEWDTEPPLIVYGMKENPVVYQGAPADLRAVLYRLPVETWQRGRRTEFIKQFLLSDNCSWREVASQFRREDDLFEAAATLLSLRYGETPTGWRAAKEWFDLVEELLSFGGIASHQTISHGYSQGAAVLVMAIATLEWLETTGVQPEHVQTCLEGACALYGWWAWGDVYGVTKILRPDGTEIPDSSCWNFFGPHQQSGILENAQERIERDKRQQAWEAGEAAYWACRGVVTV